MVFYTLVCDCTRCTLIIVIIIYIFQCVIGPFTHARNGCTFVSTGPKGLVAVHIFEAVSGLLYSVFHELHTAISHVIIVWNKQSALY